MRVATISGWIWLAGALFFSACTGKESAGSGAPVVWKSGANHQPADHPFVVVLGIAQDAGYPQAGCTRDCCRDAFLQPSGQRLVSCLGIVDPLSGQAWMLDATPDFRDQLYRLQNAIPGKSLQLAGIFLTHGHIGHYTGLMQLGREVMGAAGIPVYVMPRMRAFLEENGPWSQLVQLKNVVLRNLEAGSVVYLNERIRIEPLPVPHRDEYSETVGFRVSTDRHSLVFIPDIDKWNRWDMDVNEVVRQTDVALLDGTFYRNGEIPGRDMSEIPHPFIEESMVLFKSLQAAEKAKIHFIHFNHTNPVLLENSEARKSVLDNGFGICEEGRIFEL